MTLHEALKVGVASGLAYFYIKQLKGPWLWFWYWRRAIYRIRYWKEYRAITKLEEVK